MEHSIPVGGGNAEEEEELLNCQTDLNLNFI
jgi:hypothetical protein